MLSAFCNAICNLQFSIFDFRFSIFDFRFLFNFLITTNFDQIVQYSSKYCIIVQFHHAFSILHHCMHPCNAMHPCNEALPASLARQSCRKVCKLFYGRRPACMHACSIAYFYSAGSLVQAFPAIKDIAILSLVYELISTCERR
jgi:hypothetical protein